MRGLARNNIVLAVRCSRMLKYCSLGFNETRDCHALMLKLAFHLYNLIKYFPYIYHIHYDNNRQKVCTGFIYTISHPFHPPLIYILLHTHNKKMLCIYYLITFPPSSLDDSRLIVHYPKMFFYVHEAYCKRSCNL